MLVAALGEAAWHRESYGTGAMDAAHADKRISKQRVETVTSAAERDTVWVSKLYILWYWMSAARKQMQNLLDPCCHNHQQTPQTPGGLSLLRVTGD